VGEGAARGAIVTARGGERGAGIRPRAHAAARRRTHRQGDMRERAEPLLSWGRRHGVTRHRQSCCRPSAPAPSLALANPARSCANHLPATPFPPPPHKTLPILDGGDDYDFYCRFFGPWVSIDEDPATGEAGARPHATQTAFTLPGCHG
jgi:hypothetical protein